MKVILILSIFIFYFKFYSQTDTIRSNDPRYISNIVFSQLNPNIYQGRLLNRSMSDFECTNQQIRGRYNQTHDAFSFLGMYSDAAYSYVDSNKLMNNIQLATYIFDFFGRKELETEDLEQPFGLLLHNLYVIDSTKLLNNSFTTSNNRLIAQVPQNTLYKTVVLKSAALLEFESDNGYNRGKIIYDEKFISVSDDIKIQSIKINTGNGFKNFGAKNHIFEYDRGSDFMIAYAAIKYKLNNQVIHDTLQFYLTKKTGNYTYGSSNQNKDTENDYEGEEYESEWDFKDNWYGLNSDLVFRYGVKFGCGNGIYIRRPIIFAPPYRPSVQPISLNKYYTQFGFKSLFEHLTSLGYDVIFIKEKPGNSSIEKAGEELANFIKYVNYVKKQNYPNEDWENVLVGFSAGGQHARYALMHLEKLHMDNAEPHHHTRLYVPFDSPHWGAHVPMSSQAVFNDLKATNVFAAMTNMCLIDEASKDMLMNHIVGSNITNSGDLFDYDYYINPAPSSERTILENRFNTQFIHQYTQVNDLRKSFPSFTRNVAISTGNNDQNYTSEYNLNPGVRMFKQDIYLPAFYGASLKVRNYYAAKYANNANAFDILDVRFILFLIPIVHNKVYKTNYLPELDMAQGGYKDEFYDGALFNVVPIGALPILRTGTWGIGTKYYNSHVNFMPLVSSLGINPSIWANNNLYYNLKDKGLMYRNQLEYDNDDPSDLFGYPNLAFPSSHFNITPFEAVFADGHTYDHIKMQKSIDDAPTSEGMSNDDLVYLRNFIVEEVEADVVCLQNKVIGNNHQPNDPTYRYKAWYKAERAIKMGNAITPKTDVGDFVIEQTGAVTVYAGFTVSLTNGFHTQSGSHFHAFIAGDGCQRPGMAKKPDEIDLVNQNTNTKENGNPNQELEDDTDKNIQKSFIIPNPNQGVFILKLNANYQAARIEIIDIYGHSIYKTRQYNSEMNFDLNLQTGIYFLKIEENNIKETLKFIIQ